MGVKGRRWIKTRVREAAEIKKAEIKAEATALRQVNKKKSGLEILKEYLDKALAKVDPMEAVAVIGGTILIKQGIQWTEELVNSKQGLDIVRFFARLGSMGLSDWYLLGTPQPTPEQQAEIQKVLDTPQAEIVEWIISFTLSYILIHNAGAILEATGNFVGAAKSLLGVVAAA